MADDDTAKGTFGRVIRVISGVFLILLGLIGLAFYYIGVGMACGLHGGCESSTADNVAAWVGTLLFIGAGVAAMRSGLRHPRSADADNPSSGSGP
jgi:hypothetical protein